MGIKTQGGLWCDRCGPVPGEKTTHRIRGVVGIVAAGATGGLSLVGAIPDSYHCPKCGGPVRRTIATDYVGSWRQAAREAKPRIGSPEWQALRGDESQLARSERERADRQAHPESASTAQGVEPVADQLDRLTVLRASGALTEAEFEAAKRRVLTDASPRPPGPRRPE